MAGRTGSPEKSCGPSSPGVSQPETVPNHDVLPDRGWPGTFTPVMMPLSVLRSVARQCIAAAAMFGFSLNVATPTIMHGCAHPASAGAQASGGTHAGRHGHQQAPSEHSSHSKTCQCVGHSCGTVLAVPASVATGPRVVPAITRSELVRSADRLPAVRQHLLPFAVGPPSSLPA